MFPSPRNQSIDLQCKSMDWFLWVEHCHERRLILFCFYFYFLSSFINTVMRNISYRDFLFFPATFIIIYHMAFTQRRLKLGVIFASNSNRMLIYKFFFTLAEIMQYKAWMNHYGQFLKPFIYFVKGNQKEPLIFQKHTLLPFLMMITETICLFFH